MGLRHRVTAPTSESRAWSKRGCSPSTNPTFLTAGDYGPRTDNLHVAPWQFVVAAAVVVAVLVVVRMRHAHP
jgi:hypothetical protein